MPILNLEQNSEQVPIGDMPFHPALVSSCFTFINFSITEFGLGYLETYPPTPSYVGTCYFNNQHHGYGSTAQNHFHRSPFARPHTISHTIGHKHYRVSLSSELRLSWFWFIHKPTLHRSPFARPHIVNITVGHKHYRVSLSSDLRSSRLWINYTKPFSSVALHIQQRLLRRELHAMGTIAS